MNITMKIAATVAAFAATSAFAAEITGKIKLNGEAPPAREITPIKADKLCGPLHSAPVMTRTYVVGADKGLANVAVYIKAGLPAGKTYTVPTEKPLIDQIGCVYEPFISVAMVGQTVDIKNSDAFMHNVNCQAKVNKGFNFAQATKDQVNPRVFDKPELGVKLICNVHPWMSGYVHVFDHPFFAVTDKDGNFAIKGDLPDGKYTVEANHLKSGTVTGEVEVKGGKATLNLELAVK
jgi:plastocyanin